LGDHFGDVVKSSNDFMQTQMMKSSKKVVEFEEESDSEPLSYHESSINEEELLSDVQRHFKDDDYLSKIARKMNIGNLYKKYFNLENEQELIEEKANDFIESAKKFSLNESRKTCFSADKVIRINRYDIYYF
jgi:phosphoenolpyruvate-protein kinase (PTS system EI component)